MVVVDGGCGLARGARGGGAIEVAERKEKKKEAPLFRFGREEVSPARECPCVRTLTTLVQQMGGLDHMCLCVF